MDPRFRRAIDKATPWFFAWVLNALVFVPSFLFSQPRATFFPNLARMHASSAHGFVRPLVSFVLRRDNLDIFRISLNGVSGLTPR